MSLFEILQEQVSLKELAGRFTQLRASGDKLKGCCPHSDHADTSPSFYVYPDGRFRCYGCGRHGDVVDLWAGVGRLEPGIGAAIDLAREYGVELPELDPKASEKAQERREKEDLNLRQSEVWHQALSRHPGVVAWWEERGFDEELRERFLLGANRDGTAAVIPYWHRGRVHGLIRRKLAGDPKYLYPKAVEFAKGYRPLFTVGPTHSEVCLVEGPVDALAAAALGEGALAVGSSSISEQQRRELKAIPGPVYVLPDDDETGAKAAHEWARELYPKAQVCSPEYGEGCKDLADLFQTGGEAVRDVLKALKSRAVDALDVTLSEAPEGSARERYGYAKDHVLPLLARLEDEGEREAALQDAADGLKLKASQLRKALTRVELPEAAKPADQVSISKPQGERHESALTLLKNPDLLEVAVEDMEKLGHVGERGTKKLALICAVSALAGNPIQPSTHAQSSAGKNALWDTVLSLLPEEMVVRRSGLSAKALFRTEADLKGAVLYLQEVAGSEEASYTIRVMQSDGRLEYEATEKMPDGSMKNVVYQTEGPTVIVQTTTKNHLHPENETRVFPIYIDESDEQTSRIVKSILAEATGGGTSASERESIRQRWRDAIRLLEPAEALIPYANRIEIPNSPIRIRRDARRLVDVVRVIAWLHQHQRKRDDDGRILATEEDFHTALGLISESLTRAWRTLTPAEETVLRAIKDLPEQLRTRGFRRRDLKVKGVSDRRVKEILSSLTDTGYLDCDERKGPQGYSYTVAREAEEVSLGIYLRPSPDRRESGLDKTNPTGRDAFARYRPTPDDPDDREAGATGRNGYRPIKHSDLQQEHATGRTGGGERERLVL